MQLNDDKTISTSPPGENSPSKLVSPNGLFYSTRHKIGNNIFILYSDFLKIGRNDGGIIF
jgi:hypothetical protein